jgi:hypothetical protein
MQTLANKKRTVTELSRLIADWRIEEGLRFFAFGCKQHNPYVRGGMASSIVISCGIDTDNVHISPAN